MPAEIKSGLVDVEIRCSRSLKSAFKKHCKALNVSVAQRIRDLMQKELHEFKHSKPTKKKK